MKFGKLANLSLVGLSVVFISACQASPDQMVEKTETNAEEIVAQLEVIQSNEANLQSAFETDLAADEDLANFAESGEGETRKNLSARQDAWEELSSLFTQFQEDTGTLNEFDETDFTAEEDFNQFNEMRSVASTASEQLGAYVGQYKGVLEKENAYYNALPEEDSDLTTFKDGMDEINNQFEESQKSLNEVIPALTTLSENTAESASN